VNGFYVKGRV